MSEHERVTLRGMKLGWSDRRTEALLSRVQVRLGRQKVVLRAALASALVAVVSGVGAVRHFARAPVLATLASASAPHAASPRSIRLREGSEIRLVSPASELRVAEESSSRVLVEQVHGAARYSVVPNPARAFEVHTGSVTVKVVGTEFLVEERGERTWVEVARGKVRVSSSSGEAEVFLAAGESGLFPRVPAASAAASASPELETTDATANREGARVAYRAHLAQKDYRAAFALLSRNPSVAGDSVQDLLLAADVARLSEHPSEAVPYLQRIVREHASDERAPLAAFTLGRTLSGLGRTREAMSMFGRVRSAWSHSPLAEDALVREAEAAAALGESGTAKRLAAEYERDYPNGRRRADVRRYAGL